MTLEELVELENYMDHQELHRLGPLPHPENETGWGEFLPRLHTVGGPSSAAPMRYQPLMGYDYPVHHPIVDVRNHYDPYNLDDALTVFNAGMP